MEKIALFIASIFTILSIVYSFPLSCPEEEKIKPCGCKDLATGLNILCADFNDSQKLVSALKNLANYKIKKLILHNLILNNILPGDLFLGLEISEIAVEKSNLTFSKPAFKGLDGTLEKLNINQYSIIKSSEKFMIAKLQSLTELTMKKNPLNTVKNHWFNGKIPSVENIRLDDDEIREIENGTFANLTRLQTISIAGNRIKEVMRSMFPKPAENLTEIDLSGNEIQYLPEDFFTDMPALEKVILSGNDLTTLDENTWKPVWRQLKTLLLFDNSLMCDSSLNWIPKLGWPEDMEAKCVAPSVHINRDLKDVYDIMMYD